MALSLTAIPGTNTFRVSLTAPLTPAFIVMMQTPRFGPDISGAGLGALDVAMSGVWVGDIYVAEPGEPGVYVDDIWVPEIVEPIDPAENNGLGFSLDDVPGYTEAVAAGLPPLPDVIKAVVEIAGGPTAPTGAPGPPPVPWAQWDNTRKLWYVPGIVAITPSARELAQATINGFAADFGLTKSINISLPALIASGKLADAKKRAESITRSLSNHSLMMAVQLGMRVTQTGALKGQLASDARNRWLLEFANVVNSMPEAFRPDSAAVGITLGTDATIDASTPAGAALAAAALSAGISPTTGGVTLPNGTAPPPAVGAPMTIGGVKMGTGMWIGLALLAAAAAWFFMK